mgnify:CR=1 FL=1
MFNPGKQQDIRLADGRFARLGKLRLSVLRAFRDWVAEKAGDPFETVERWIDRVPAEETVRQLKEAEDVRDQLRFFSLACPLAARLLGTEEGLAKLLHLLMLERDAKAREEDAFEAVLAINEEAMTEQVLARAQGTESSSSGQAKNSPGPAPLVAGPVSAGATSTGD